MCHNEVITSADQSKLSEQLNYKEKSLVKRKDES